jgi:hypothetical protein
MRLADVVTGEPGNVQQHGRRERRERGESRQFADAAPCRRHRLHKTDCEACDHRGDAAGERQIATRQQQNGKPPARRKCACTDDDDEGGNAEELEEIILDVETVQRHSPDPRQRETTSENRAV